MVLVVINGAAMSGKDTFVEQCRKVMDNKLVFNVSTVDFVKQIAKECGWDGTKTIKNRDFLATLKDLLTEWGDIPYKKIEKSIEEFKAYLRVYDVEDLNSIVFIHCREPKEIQKFVERKGAITLFISRPGIDPIQTNDADSNVRDYSYDYYISNDGTIDDLKEKAREFLHKIFNT